jgi:hypothetical protein
MHVSVRDDRPAARDLCESRGQIAAGDVQGAGNVSGGKFLVTADINDHRLWLTLQQCAQLLDADVFVAHRASFQVSAMLPLC